ncbi:MAG: SDR family oxidoreductase [Elusimicrobia bacterium]|nr:SDR family oxidoreductase [Elusimicrobiota bacterium]
MTDDSFLSGKVALVTGASGGIGSAIARAFARRGCAVALHYRSGKARAERLRRELSGLGARCVILRADLLKDGAPAALVRAAVRALGRLDILVNNAGAVIGYEHFSSLRPVDWDRTLRVNASAPFFLSREAFAAMRRDGGRIINIGSVAAKFGGSPRSLHYAAAKAALEAVSAGLAKQGAAHNILVNTIRAGVIDTRLHAALPGKDLAARVALVPLKRMGTPEEVAQAALYLAGPGGAFVTGQVLGVSGGE